MNKPRLPYWLLLIGAYALALVVAIAIAGCASPSALQATVEAAVADGQVSPEEVQQIQSVLPYHFDWKSLLEGAGGIALSVGGAYLGLKPALGRIDNKHILGEEEAAALAELVARRLPPPSPSQPS